MMDGNLRIKKMLEKKWVYGIMINYLKNATKPTSITRLLL